MIAELAIEQGLHTVLLANEVIRTTTNSGVFNLHALRPTPYIIYSLNAGGERLEQQRGQGDFRYVVKAVVSENEGGAGAAGQLAAAIYTALHNVHFLIAETWRVYACQRTTVVKYHELIEKRNFYHHGAIYRIRVGEVLA